MISTPRGANAKLVYWSGIGYDFDKEYVHFFSCYFDIDKWCIVQMEASPGNPGSNVKTRSEMGYGFLGSDRKRGMKNHIFWYEIGSGF